MRKQFCAAALTFLAAVWSSAATADILIKVDWTLAGDTLRYGPQSLRDELVFTLRGKDITVSHDGMVIGSKSIGQANYFGSATVSTRVQGGTLIFDLTYLTHTVAFSVSTDGKSSCEARVAIAKRNGAENYVIDFPLAGQVALRSVQAKDIICAISSK